MPFSSLRVPTPAHDYPDPAPFGWYWERRSGALRRILAGGRWSVHDVINCSEIRQAVTEQWRMARRMGRDREMSSYIQHLEYLETIAQDVMTAPR